MDLDTTPMGCWLEDDQIARIRETIARIGPDAGWFAADVLHRLAATAPDTVGLLGETMGEQRRSLVEALGWAGCLHDRSAFAAKFAAVAAAEPGSGPATRVEATFAALADAFAAWPGVDFDDDTRSAWHSLRTLSILLLEGQRARVAA
ncbi:MAG: hypothetical protein J0L88_04795 [Xanthomonadales bacterium]|nr:hypothetical protein [Xanthomonadales bacterium]